MKKEEKKVVNTTEKKVNVKTKKEFKVTDKKKVLRISLIVALIVLALALVFVIWNREQGKKFVRKNTNVDFEDAAYKGKKIVVDSDRVTIVEDNNSKTVEIISDQDSEYKKLNSAEKEKFKISNLDVKYSSINTIVTGKIKNVSSSYKKVIVNVRFYDEYNKVIGSSSSVVKNLGKGKDANFSVTILGEFENYQYDVEVIKAA